MKNRLLILLGIIFFNINFVSSKNEKLNSEDRKYFIGSSMFMLGNLFPDPPSYYRLDFGYRITSKDAIIIQPLTWKYPAPLGIPYGASFGDKTEEYPGSVRAFGLGFGYNRTLWKGLFLGVYAAPFSLKYMDTDGNKIQNGFQLFTQFQIDYHFEFFKKRFYIEPGITFNYWPINTNIPVSFKIKEDRWPNYFLFEPVMNFGINF